MSGQNSIERAADQMDSLPGAARHRDPLITGAGRTGPGRPDEASSRVLKVDRKRLREQNMIVSDGERTAVEENFRRIKRQVLANLATGKAGGPPPNLVMVTSARAGEGKTFCAINLAISIALEMDRTVLLVDADVAKPGIPRALGLKAEKGLMEVLLERNVDLPDVLWRTDIGKLTLLPVGSPHKHATELLASEAMGVLLRDMAQRYHDRIIIFDSPPLLAASEAGALAGQMGQIVVVVEAGRTSHLELMDALGRVDAGRVAGLVLNKVGGRDSEYRYASYD
jgi:protein-tyrosine kinase